MKTPEEACPICGIEFAKNAGADSKALQLLARESQLIGKIGRTSVSQAIAWTTHQCAEKTLRGIDGAHKRDADEPHPFSIQLPEDLRLAEGLALMTEHDLDFEHPADEPDSPVTYTGF